MAVAVDTRRCDIDGCGAPHKARGLCVAHYHRLNRYGNPLAGGPGRQRYDTGAVCSVEDCERRPRGRGLCNRHLVRLIKTGSPTTPPLPVGGSVRRGRIWTTVDGYRMVYQPEHPNARKGGDVPEHVVVMSDTIGRPLRKGETVHHKNGIRGDNRPGNLQLMVSAHPRGQSVDDLVAFAVEILADYRPELLSEGAFNG